MKNAKALIAGLAGMAASIDNPPTDANGTAVAIPRFTGAIMPTKEWKRRKKRISMQKSSRKANRKHFS